MYLNETNIDKRGNKMIKKSNLSKVKQTRTGCKDVFNAFMVKDSEFDDFDIPVCKSTGVIPKEIIRWDEAVTIYNKNIKSNNEFFLYEAYICFYLDDQKFDGPSGIWYNSEKALNIISHFSGIITPDFSTNVDFPLPLKIYNTYRMRAFGCWINSHNIPVINNIRWGDEDTYEFSFSGIEYGSIVAIGTVGGGPRSLENRERFNKGLKELVKRKNPKMIIVYGSSNSECFTELKELGIQVVTFKSKTAKAYEEVKPYV